MKCKNCKYHDSYTCVCFNPDSPDRADFTDNEHVCNVWELQDEIRDETL